MRIIRILLLVATCVVLLPTATPARAASCKGASHEMTLTRGTASPSSGTSATPFRFSTVYTDNNDCPPISITVTVSGVGTFPLAEVGPHPSGGVTYARTMPLPVGFRSYYFSATSGEGAGELTVQLTAVSPSSLRITAPPPSPTPVPTPRPPSPTPPPTPPPTPVPTPKPPAAPPPPAPASTPVPATPAPSATDPAAGEPSPSERESSGPPEPSAPSVTPSPTATDGAPALPGAGPLDPDGGGGPGGHAPDWLLPWVLLGTISGGLFFVLARRRRHPEEAPTTITATAAAAAPTAVSAEGPVQAVTPLPPMRELIPPVDPDLLRDADDDPRPRADEANIPRWLRPSVRQARYRGSRYTRNDNWD